MAGKYGNMIVGGGGAPKYNRKVRKLPPMEKKRGKPNMKNVQAGARSYMAKKKAS